jgi:DNA helicase HerA-like ATPase
MTKSDHVILLAKGATDIVLLPQMANRHGLISGATGTGKTITLRVLAEQFSKLGVPVFLTDVKGDLTGLAMPGENHPHVIDRVRQLVLTGYQPESFPVVFWDLFAEQGHPMRTTISDMGPLLMSKILGLNDTQSGVLHIAFKIADDNGLLLLDLKDLRALIQHVGDHAADYKTSYGNISAASIGAIQRKLITLQQEGADRFFGEPALNMEDILQTAADGRGVIHILAANRLMQSPKVYTAFLLWMLSELFENLPEVGDLEKPKLILFFDEAHLLFDDLSTVLQEKIEQVIRLIRSKGVGVYFVTQSPLDIPDTILGQLGNRVQHALRSYTPRDQKTVKAAAETFRQNPAFDTEQAIAELSIGEALISVLDASGAPTMVQRAFICPPRSRLSPLSASELAKVIDRSLLAGRYEHMIDRESAYEQLRLRSDRHGESGSIKKGEKTQTDVIIGALAKSALHAIGSQLGRQIARGILGSLFGSKR